jgi:hypothetical protein
MGSLKNKSPPPGFGPNGSTIEMLEDGKFGKILGVPFWKSGDEDTYWKLKPEWPAGRPNPFSPSTPGSNLQISFVTASPDIGFNQ